MAAFLELVDLDYDEIIRRGGANGGQEDFLLVGCANCGAVISRISSSRKMITHEQPLRASPARHSDHP